MGALGEKINAGFTENAMSYLLFLRLVPLFPFFLVNLAPAFTDIRLATFVAGTFIGIIPATFVYVNLGETLGRIDSLSGLVSRETIGALVLLGLLALVPVLVRKWRVGARWQRLSADGYNRTIAARLTSEHPCTPRCRCSRRPTFRRSRAARSTRCRSISATAATRRATTATSTRAPTARR